MWWFALVLSSIFVVDGDTFHSEGIKVRLWGINSPEIDTKAGKQAKKVLLSLVKDSTLYCYEQDVDHYGRIVAQCFLPDGRDLACVLVEHGAAHDWPLFSDGYYKECENER